MMIDDFIYDGIRLSSFGYMVGYLDDSSDLNNIDTDSQRSFNTLSMFGGKWHPLSVSTYKDALRLNLSVIKNPCNFTEHEEMYISLTDIRKIKRWLNRPTFHRLKIIDAEGEWSDIFFNCSANVEEVHMMGYCVGFDITFYTDRPFALVDDRIYSGTVAGGSSITITDSSDEIGYIYPDMTITVLSGGTLTITNSFDQRRCIVESCVANEAITFTSTLQVTSSIGTHNMGNSFNWHFVRINNSYTNRINKLTFNLPCRYEIKYNPIVKAVIG